MKHIRILSAALLAVMLVSVCAAACADELADSLNREVPFGIAHTDDGSGIFVYRSASARNSWDTLEDYQICAILSTQVSGGKTWYRIRYVNGNALSEGYIPEDGFYQMTVAGLVSIASDSSSSAILKALVGSTDANVLVAQAQPTATPTPTPKATKRATATPTPKAARKTATPASGRKRYVLNTKTMKFHLPGCSEVSRITAENKKTTTTTREALISQGYEACQKCNP